MTRKQAINVICWMLIISIIFNMFNFITLLQEERELNLLRHKIELLKIKLKCLKND